MTARDPRDVLADRVQRFVEDAIDNPTKRPKITHFLFGEQPRMVGPLPGRWPPPTARARERASVQCLAAAEAAREALTAMGVSILYTSLRELPEVSVVWEPLRPEQKLPPAPLVHCLTDERARDVMAKLALYAFSRHTAKYRDQHAFAQLRRRLNAFARLEINLWSFAADSGHLEPPPYAVRYDLARWLWHPSIAGDIFCLRCGDELRYVRSQRTARGAGRVQRDSRTARCRACARGAEDNWPPYELEPEPYRRGTWLLRCQFSGCARAFVGRCNAVYCPRHRASRMSPRLRTEGRRRSSEP